MGNQLTAQDPVSMPTVCSRLFDPPDELASLRAERPLCRLRYVDGELGWLVTSHSLARSVLRDPRFGRDDPNNFGSFFGGPARVAEFKKALEPYPGWRPMRGFIEMNSPEHSRYRRLLAEYFTTGCMGRFRPRVERIVSERLDALERGGPPTDLVSTFAAPVSLASQCALLGIPASESERFFRLGTSLANTSIAASDVVAAWRDAWEFMRALARQRRIQPTDDVLSDIAQRRELNDDELADTALVLFQGGLETTGDMLALAAFILLCHPQQLEELRSDPSIIGPAVDELLRYGGIFRLAAPRVAFQDVELGGVVIRAGESVIVSLAAANRDGEKFDHPDELDLTRSAVGHVAFAQGTHICIGQHLARLELQVGIRALLERFPKLRLAVPAEEVPVYGSGYQNFGVYELPASW